MRAWVLAQGLAKGVCVWVSCNQLENSTEISPRLLWQLCKWRKIVRQRKLD